MKQIFLIISFLILFCSCDMKNKNFEVSSVDTKFTYLESYSKWGGLSEIINAVKEKRNTRRTILHDVRYIDVDFDINNLTAENIETGSFSATLILDFKSDKKYLYFPLNPFQTESDKLWSPNELKKVSSRLWISDLEDYDPNIFKHKPENIKLQISVFAKNSVGFDSASDNSIVFDENIDLVDWQ